MTRLLLAALAGALLTISLAILLRPAALELGAAIAFLRARAQRRRLDRETRRVLAGRKASILAVGTITFDVIGTIHLGPGWKFDNSVGAPEHYVDERGVYRYLGYTLAEMREIHARRAEFSTTE